ncbi:MAG: element excision factor XisI family protein [Bacteroidota bacterium]
MDQIIKYWDVIKNELEKEAKYVYKNQPGLSNELLISENGKHLLLITSGWHNRRYNYILVYHFEMKEGRIWLLANNSDEDVIAKYSKFGIPTKIFYDPYLEEQIKAAA